MIMTVLLLSTIHNVRSTVLLRFTSDAFPEQIWDSQSNALTDGDLLDQLCVPRGGVLHHVQPRPPSGLRVRVALLPHLPQPGHGTLRHTHHELVRIVSQSDTESRVSKDALFRREVLERLVLKVNINIGCLF